MKRCSLVFPNLFPGYHESLISNDLLCSAYNNLEGFASDSIFRTFQIREVNI